MSSHNPSRRASMPGLAPARSAGGDASYHAVKMKYFQRLGAVAGRSDTIAINSRGRHRSSSIDQKTERKATTAHSHFESSRFAQHTPPIQIPQDAAPVVGPGPSSRRTSSRRTSLPLAITKGTSLPALPVGTVPQFSPPKWALNPHKADTALDWRVEQRERQMKVLTSGVSPSSSPVTVSPHGTLDNRSHATTVSSNSASSRRSSAQPCQSDLPGDGELFPFEDFEEDAPQMTHLSANFSNLYFDDEQA